MEDILQLTPQEQLRKDLLDSLVKKQSFRVSIGMSQWVEYKEFNPLYNLREILDDEIVIEFDTDRETSVIGINVTCINLYSSGYIFEVWDHKGRSPHIHIKDLPISNLPKERRSLFKKLFIKKYVPEKFLKFVDMSLTGIHLVRIEHSNCFKGKYGTKELLFRFDPKESTYQLGGVTP